MVPVTIIRYVWREGASGAFGLGALFLIGVLSFLPVSNLVDECIRREMRGLQEAELLVDDGDICALVLVLGGPYILHPPLRFLVWWLLIYLIMPCFDCFVRVGMFVWMPSPARRLLYLHVSLTRAVLTLIGWDGMGFVH